MGHPPPGAGRAGGRRTSLPPPPPSPVAPAAPSLWPGGVAVGLPGPGGGGAGHGTLLWGPLWAPRRTPELGQGLREGGGGAEGAWQQRGAPWPHALQPPAHRCTAHTPRALMPPTTHHRHRLPTEATWARSSPNQQLCPRQSKPSELRKTPKNTCNPIVRHTLSH